MIIRSTWATSKQPEKKAPKSRPKPERVKKEEPVEVKQEPAYSFDDLNREEI